MLSLILKGIKYKKGESFLVLFSLMDIKYNISPVRGILPGNNITSRIKDKKGESLFYFAFPEGYKIRNLTCKPNITRA